MGRAKCFVVTLMRGEYKHYLIRVNLEESEGYFSIDLKDAQKFANESDAQRLANHFKDARVETIKTGEILKSDRK